MKIALIGPAHPYRGGIAQYTNELQRALSEEHWVYLVSLKRQYPEFVVSGRRQREPGEPLMGPSVDALLDPLNPLSWRKLGNRLASLDLDAVLFQWWQPFFALAYASLAKRVRRLSDARILFLCHNVFPHEHIGVPGGERLENWLIGRVLEQGDGFLVQARGLIDEVRRFHATAPVRTIHHPCYDFFRRKDRSAPSGTVEKGGRKQLLFFGNIREYKGLDVFLEALHRIGDRLEYRAIVAGEFFVDPKPYYRLCKRLGLDGRVCWKEGYVPDSEIPDLFRGADLVVLPYKRATQSGVVPLAYEFGVPVVATAVGGLAEVVEDGKTGFLAPADDPAALAARILDFFNEGREAEFRAAIARFKEQLSWQQVVDNILAILNQPAGEGDSPRGGLPDGTGHGEDTQA